MRPAFAHDALGRIIRKGDRVTVDGHGPGVIAGFYQQRYSTPITAGVVTDSARYIRADAATLTFVPKEV